MSRNFRIVHFASGAYGLAAVHYSDDIPANAKKGDGKSLEWSLQSITAVEPNAFAATAGQGIDRLKEMVKEARDAFLRPVIEEADLPKREPYDIFEEPGWSPVVKAADGDAPQ